MEEFDSVIEELCRKRISAAIEERDDEWRRHERSQITYLQNENAQMLSGLHTEIERLRNHLRGMEFLL